MPRLIDADALNWGRCPANGKLVSDWLAEAPTIEAEPVRHGRWEEYQVPHIVCCSECDWGTGVQDKYNYCPNCGAKMDGGGDDK